jgi:hypothetical protein
VGIASFSQPLLQNYLLFLLDLSEYHSNAVAANVCHLTLSREDRAAVNDPKPNLCADRPGFLGTYLAAEDAEVRGLLADLPFGFHVHQINASGERIPSGSRSFDQRFSPGLARAVWTDGFFMMDVGRANYVSM